MGALSPLSEQEQAALKKRTGAAVRLARHGLGLSQAAMAARMGKSKSWLRKIELGENAAPLAFCVALSRASTLSLAAILGCPGDPDPIQSMREALATAREALAGLEATA